MIRCDKKSVGTAVRWVSRAKSLRGRLLEHISISEENPCLVEHREHEQDYCWAEIGRLDARLASVGRGAISG